jgi:hypothetical protein
VTVKPSVLVEQERQRLVYADRREMAALFLIEIRPKMSAKKRAAATLSRPGAMVWFRMIVIGSLAVSRLGPYAITSFNRRRQSVSALSAVDRLFWQPLICCNHIVNRGGSIIAFLPISHGNVGGRPRLQTSMPKVSDGCNDKILEEYRSRIVLCQEP